MGLGIAGPTYTSIGVLWGFCEVLGDINVLFKDEPALLNLGNSFINVSLVISSKR
jgi:hypothetical protein